jgi:hypothetical protein
MFLGGITMRKLFIIGLMFLSTLTLSACDMLGGDLGETLDNVNMIAETFTMEDQTIEIGTENYDWAAYVLELNENLPENINIEVVEDNIEYGVVGTYTVTLRLTAPDLDFTHTFNVSVVEGGWSPEDIVENFDGDFQFLETFMNPIMNSDAKETTTTVMFSWNQSDFMSEETVEMMYSMVSRSTLVLGDDMDLMSREISFNMAGELRSFDFYVAREDTMLRVYIDRQVLEEFVEDQTLFDELGISEDYLMFTIEGDFAYEEETEDINLILDELIVYLQDLSGEIDPEELANLEEELTYLLEQIQVFEHYLSLEYYMNQEGMTTDLDVNEEGAVVMSMTMASDFYRSVLSELAGDLQTFMMGFEEVEVPDLDSTPEFEQFLMILDGLQPMQLDAVYDPANPTQLAFRLDLTSFVNTLALLAGMPSFEPPVNQLTIDVVVRDGAEVALPENATDMNEVVRDVAKVLFVQEVLWTMDDLIYEVENGPENPLYEETEVPVNVLYDLSTSSGEFYGLFDLNLSYVVNRGTMDQPDYYFQLFWLDGQMVFVEELSLDHVEELVLESTSVTPIIALVNDDGFVVDKLGILIE